MSKTEAPKEFTTREEGLQHLIQIATAFLKKKPVQIFNTHSNRWDDCCGWCDLSASPHLFRIKPEPREWWLNVYPEGVISRAYATKELADATAGLTRTECIRVREVLE